MRKRFLLEARVLGAVLWALVSGDTKPFAKAIRRLDENNRRGPRMRKWKYRSPFLLGFLSIFEFTGRWLRENLERGRR